MLYSYSAKGIFVTWLGFGIKIANWRRQSRIRIILINCKRNLSSKNKRTGETPIPFSSLKHYYSSSIAVSSDISTLPSAPATAVIPSVRGNTVLIAVNSNVK